MDVANKVSPPIHNHIAQMYWSPSSGKYSSNKNPAVIPLISNDSEKLRLAMLKKTPSLPGTETSKVYTIILGSKIAFPNDETKMYIAMAQYCVLTKKKATDDVIIALEIIKLSYISNWESNKGVTKQNIPEAADLNAKTQPK